ncbi:hypothetical protein PARPLA_03083 [Rhodobacteraceae bacterium THAF1]|nr:hypothetical protein [Palleronia sp. THAF1]QFU08482.1 hypothetical protein FIU81_07325 [Palleronia sp. THAF1]VDC29424.1 hypothetical protein PARPLA_03083 [Rhodobacteraceae bacterium THAF1]
MFTVLKILVILVLIGGLAFVGFAYVGDMEPEPQEMTVPVDLNAN